MFDRNIPQKRRNLYLVLAVFLGAAVLFAVWRILAPPIPTLLARPVAPASGAGLEDGNWYWLEGRGAKGSRVVRASGSGAAAIVTADQIASFAVGEGKVAWIAGDSDKWSIGLGSSSGAAPAVVWTGDRQPHGLCIAEHRLYWLAQTPPAVPDAGPMPPLDAGVRRDDRASGRGGAGSRRRVDGAVGPSRCSGFRNGQIYLTVSRSGFQDVTAIYSLPIGGGAPHRIATELGQQNGLLSRDGTLYWTGQSREAAQPGQYLCVRRLGANGRTEWLEDWMPPDGRLFEGARGVYYVGGGGGARSAWLVGRSDPCLTRFRCPRVGRLWRWEMANCWFSPRRRTHRSTGWDCHEREHAETGSSRRLRHGHSPDSGRRPVSMVAISGLSCAAAPVARRGRSVRGRAIRRAGEPAVPTSSWTRSRETRSPATPMARRTRPASTARPVWRST